MTFETLNKSQRSFGLPVGFVMALYCLFNPSIISVWLSLSFLGLTVDSYEYQLHVFYWCPLWQHSNRNSRKKERNLCISQHIKIWILILRFHVPYNASALLNPGVKRFFWRSKMWRHVHFWLGKWVTRWGPGKNHKNTVGNIPFLTVFDRVLSREDMAVSGGFRTKMSARGPFCGETGFKIQQKEKAEMSWRVFPPVNRPPNGEPCYLKTSPDCASTTVLDPSVIGTLAVRIPEQNKKSILIR